MPSLERRQLEELSQPEIEFGERKLPCGGARDDDQIDGCGELLAMRAKPCPDPALEAIPNHRIADLATHGDAQPAPISQVFGIIRV